MLKEVRVFASATVSNIGCGFDIMGFAIEEPGDEILLRVSNSSGVKISLITGDNERLPYTPELNTAGAPVISMLKKFAPSIGIEIEIHKKMPFGSGLGSSAASAVAATFAMNHLLELNLTPYELLPFALEGELIASGSIHADNVAPSLYGGFTLIRDYNPLDIIKIECPANLYCTILYPNIEISTKTAREILPKEIPLSKAITQWGNCSGLVAGLLTNDYSLIGRSIKDVVVEPYRAILIPGYYQIQQAALNSGALGCNISGAGPSMFALSNGQEIAQKVGDTMLKELLKQNLNGELYLSPINKLGPRVLYSK